MSALSLVSVNIERSKHLDRLVPFLREQNADVVCMQELMERDIPELEKVTSGTCHFVPRCLYAENADEEPGIQGVGIFSKIPFDSTESRTYGGISEPLPEFSGDKALAAERVIRALAIADVTSGDTTFRIATTHFTWIPVGSSIDPQRRDVVRMLEVLGNDEVVLVGDFNAPRGGEIFERIKSRYADNVPPQYKTSIDASLHRFGAVRPNDFIDKMVDGLFTSSTYRASNVQLHTGVSDHCAISATITPAPIAH